MLFAVSARWTLFNCGVFTMEEEYQKKILDEVSALKDLFLRRLMDDKIKNLAISQLKDNCTALQRQLDERAISSLIKDILLICDRIDSQEEVDDFTASVEEELLEIIARREFYRMPRVKKFDPIYHNAVGTVPEDLEYPEGSIVKVVRNGYLFKESVFRPTDVIVSVKKKEPKQL